MNYMFNRIIKFTLPFKSYVYRKVKGNRHNIYLYGAGEIGIDVFLYLKDKNVEIEGWIDQRANDCTYAVLNTKIEPTRILNHAHPSDRIIVCSIEYKNEIMKLCKQYGISEKQIITTYDNN